MVIGAKDEQVAFLKTMLALGAIDEPDGEPWLVCMPESIGNDGESYASSCSSADDVEKAADFMRNSAVRDYWPVGAVIVLGAYDEELKYVDRLLKVPHLMHGTTWYSEMTADARIEEKNRRTEAAGRKSRKQYLMC